MKSITLYFQSRKWPPQNKYLLEFENNLVEIIRSAKFKSSCHKFQDNSKPDLPSIKQSNNVCMSYNILYKIRVQTRNYTRLLQKIKTRYLQRTYKNVKKVGGSSLVNLWIDTDTVVNWFK